MKDSQKCSNHFKTTILIVFFTLALSNHLWNAAFSSASLFALLFAGIPLFTAELGLVFNSAFLFAGGVGIRLVPPTIKSLKCVTASVHTFNSRSQVAPCASQLCLSKL